MALIKRSAAAITIVFCLFHHLTVASDGVRDEAKFNALLHALLEKNERVLGAKAQLSIAYQQLKIARSVWYPELDISVAKGHHNNYNSGSKIGFKQGRGRISQLLWDFGASNAELRKAYLQLEINRLNLQQTRQTLLLEAVSVYINLIRAKEILKYASASEDNIRRQTGLEQIRVARGSGYSSDVLQSKAQLAGAISRRIQSEGALRRAENSFWQVFGVVGDTPETAHMLAQEEWQKLSNISITDIIVISSKALRLAPLPQNIKQATKLANNNNTVLRRAVLEGDIARQTRRSIKAKTLYPQIKLTFERTFDENLRGNLGINNELTSQVEISMPINLGLAGVNRLRVQTLEVNRQNFDLRTQRRSIEKQVRDRWQDLQTSQQQVSFLNQQAEISLAFLELARKERKLGQRSLIDLLGSETALVNARSDSVSAQADNLIATIALLEIIGQLTLKTEK
ncbi:TolC family protein [Agarilytica rhodophyticola]|uniref:TolC family protein n=1 Tax=Agarilytica rhodophyticola TaxID=1737490 RepID=UPI000B343516|nr:TolC family protein [Agarilytica rhodophyticola]